MRFPPSFVDRLRNHFPISEVIGRRMAIKKHGREFQGLCPFHNEKTPSFTINDDKGFFHCFGCGAHGDAIEFIKRYERLTYPETIERLAREAGIALPVETPEERRKAEAEKTLADACEAACQWFEKQLMAPAGVEAYDYVQRRGLKPETLRQFRIGFAPDSRTALHTHLTALGIGKALQVEAGLVIETDSGSVYDRFRGRVIFPIRSASGKVVAFGGRLLAKSVDGKLPKYLNSPETPLFKKGEMLYNLDLAKRPAREANMAVVMEGYMDVVSVAQAGVAYASATLGTAVTPEHLRLLWQLAKEPVLCLDGDAAGKRAMLRAVDVALPHLKPGYSLRFALLPEGEDPDSYVQKHGKASFEKLLAGSRRLSQQLWDEMLATHDTANPDGLAALKAHYRKLTEKIAEPTVRGEYLKHFDRLHYQLGQAAWKPARGSAKAKPARGPSPEVAQMVVQHYSAALDKLTRAMFQFVLRHPSLLYTHHRDEAIARLDIASPQLDALRNALLAALDHAGTESDEAFIARIRTHAGDEIVDSVLGSKLQLPYGDTLAAIDAEQLWNELFAAYELSHMELELKDLQEQLGRSLDEEGYHRLVELRAAIDKARASRTFAPAQADAIQ